MTCVCKACWIRRVAQDNAVKFIHSTTLEGLVEPFSIFKLLNLFKPTVLQWLRFGSESVLVLHLRAVLSFIFLPFSTCTSFRDTYEAVRAYVA